jgi:4-hydroxy-tetrahydrodipicolinate reductase
MGQEFVKVVPNYPDLRLEIGITLGESAPGFACALKAEQVSDQHNLDGIIDFSEPGASVRAAELAVRLKLPLVSGTTGLSETQLASLREAGKTIPLFWSPNMSLGVALLVRALQAIRPPEDFDIHLNEIHHHRKVDSPSGTALLIQSRVENAWGKKIQEPSSIRGGGDFGTHTLRLMGEFETLSFSHQALSRSVFADGALKVFSWLKSKPPGFYQFEDFFKN